MKRPNNSEEDANEIYENYAPLSADLPLTVSQIEKCKAEGEVMEWMAAGYTWQEVLVKLQATYPNQDFSKKDLDLFLIRNGEINKALIRGDAATAVRHVDANVKFKTTLTQMQDVVLDMLHDARDEKNYSGVSSLHNSMINNLKLWAQVSGMLSDSKEININVGRAIGEAMETQNRDKRAEILEVASTIVISPEDLNNNSTNSSEEEGDE